MIRTCTHVSMSVALALGLALVACRTEPEEASGVETFEEAPAAAARAGSTAPFRAAAPDEVCSYLEDLGLEGGVWERLDDSWACATPPVEIGVGIEGSTLGNNIVYEARGSESRVETLRLTLEVVEPAEANAAHERLVEGGNELGALALGRSLPQEALSALRAGETGDWPVGDGMVTVVEEELPDVDGYGIELIIE